MSFSASWTNFRSGSTSSRRESRLQMLRESAILVSFRFDFRGGKGRQAKKSGLKGVHVAPLSRYSLTVIPS